ncbi:MAG: CDP-alcohol phosphatidyltransferase family protein [Planctomycetota bacterium]|nr:CDP-alcohol phosphatidyltransferase family protein [Planctomycetota bacterium]
MPHSSPAVEIPSGSSRTQSTDRGWHKQWNIANQITLSRLVLALACLALIDLGWWLSACGTFLVAASTDFIDGYIARKYGLVTVLGRILDPLVDKIVVGLFITSLRGMLEASGQDFSAAWSGKVKMFVQCAAVICVLLALANRDFQIVGGEGWQAVLDWTRVALLWGTVATTLYSGYVYVERAAKMFRGGSGS